MAVDKTIEYKMQGGVKNYKPSKMVKAPVTAKSSPDTPTAHLAYITDKEKDILIDLNLYGSLKGKPNRGPSGIPSLEGDFGGPGGFGGYSGGGGGRSDNDVSGSRDRGTGDYRVTDRAVQDAYNKNRAIREANERAVDKLAGRDPRLSGGIQTNKGPMGGMGGIFGSILGMMMGIPGLGLLTGGFDKLKGGLGSLNETLGDFREKTTGFRTQKEYDDARRDRQLQGRLDDMYSAKSKGKGFSQKNIDKIEAMGFSPSTAQNVLTGRDLKGFTESRGLQTPQTFSDPFANTVGTTTKVNAPSNDAVSSVAPETGFFENQFNKFFSGPEFDAYNEVRTDKYANAPSKFNYDFNTNKAAMQMINDKITNNAKGTIFGGLPSELASVVGNIAAVPGSIPASLGHEFVQSRERVQDQFKGASPSIMAEGPSIGDYYSGFMNENPFATAGTRALGIGAALPDALGKVYNSLGFADGGVASMFTRRG